MRKPRLAPLALVLPLALNGCGLATPDMEMFADKSPADELMHSRQGMRENDILSYIECEVGKGLWRVWSSKGFRTQVPWLFYYVDQGVLRDGDGSEVTLFDAKGKPLPKPYFAPSTNDLGWGVAIYLQMQVDEESQMNPGVGLNHPFRNAYATAAGANSVPWTATNLLQPTITAIPQFFSLGVGVGAAARATRVEAVQFTAQAARLLQTAIDNRNANGEYVCVASGKIPVLIDSDLKIDDFIVAKATLAASTNYAVKDDHTQLPRAPYNAFQETINFVATFNGGVTPSWKLARTSINPNTPMASVQRDEINTVIVTLGQMTTPGSQTPDPPKPPSSASIFMPAALLASAGAQQHQAATAAQLIGSAQRSVSP